MRLALAAFLALSACAAPNADQGQGQGSSSTPTFVFAPVFTFGAVTGGLSLTKPETPKVEAPVVPPTE